MKSPGRIIAAIACILCLGALAAVAGTEDASTAIGQAPCCFENPRFSGTCEVTPGEDESCGSILGYLNNPNSVGKTYQSADLLPMDLKLTVFNGNISGRKRLHYNRDEQLTDLKLLLESFFTFIFQGRNQFPYARVCSLAGIVFEKPGDFGMHD